MLYELDTTVVGRRRHARCGCRFNLAGFLGGAFRPGTRTAPLGANFAGLGYVRTGGETALDPVLRLTDVEVELDTAAVKTIHSFGLLGKFARFDLVRIYPNSCPPATILQYATYTHSRAANPLL